MSAQYPILKLMLLQVNARFRLSYLSESVKTMKSKYRPPLTDKLYAMAITKYTPTYYKLAK
jgi:hypothetical protein